MKRISLVLFLAMTSIFVRAQSQAQKPYGIIIKGGHVIDPKNNIDEIMDVAISPATPGRSAQPARPARPAQNGQPARPAQPAQPAVPAAEGKIALVAKNIDPNLGRLVIDATGMYVTPGLIDMHSHVFPGAGRGDLDPDVVTFRSGVTTTVDAGSSGWMSFPQFKRETIDKAETRVLAFLNIGGQGYWRDENGRGFESDTSLYNVQKAAETALKYKDIIVGIKAAHFGGPLYMLAIDRGIAAFKPRICGTGRLSRLSVLCGTRRRSRARRTALCNGYVHYRVDIVFGIDNMPAPDNNTIRFSALCTDKACHHHKN